MNINRLIQLQLLLKVARQEHGWPLCSSMTIGSRCLPVQAMSPPEIDVAVWWKPIFTRFFFTVSTNASAQFGMMRFCQTSGELRPSRNSLRRRRCGASA